MTEIEYRDQPDRGYWELKGVDAPTHSVAMFSAQVQLAFDIDNRIVYVAIAAHHPDESRTRAILHSSIISEFQKELGIEPGGENDGRSDLPS